MATALQEAVLPLRRRRVSRIAFGLVAAVVGVCVAVLVAARGGIETASMGAGSQSPAWTRACRGRTPRPDRVLLARCSRASGLVLFVRRSGAPQSSEVHFALLAGVHPLIVKLDDPELQPSPSIGSRVTAVGALVRARNGMREIEAWSIG